MANYLKDHYGDNYNNKAKAEYHFNGRNGRIISMDSAKVLYNSFCKWIDSTELNIRDSMNLILHNEIINWTHEEEAAVEEWNDAILKKDRYAVSTNFSLIMSHADTSQIEFEVGQVDSYKPDSVLRNAVSDAFEQLRKLESATAMIKSLALNISKNGYSSNVKDDFVRGNKTAEILFKQWNKNKRQNPGDDSVTVQRLLEASIFYRIHDHVEGFLYKKRFSKYWFAGFGFVFISDSQIYYSILGSSMRNALMSVNRKSQKVTVISLLQSALRQRLAVCNNGQNIIGYNQTTGKLYKGQPGGNDVSIAPLTIISLRDLFNIDQLHMLAFLDGFNTYGNMAWNENEVIELIDGKKKKKRVIDEE